MRFLFFLLPCFLFVSCQQNGLNLEDIAQSSYFYAYYNGGDHLINQEGKKLIAPENPIKFEWIKDFPNYILLPKEQSIELYKAGEQQAICSIPKNKGSYLYTGLVAFGEQLFIQCDESYYNLQGKKLLQSSLSYSRALSTDYYLFTKEDSSAILNTNLEIVYTFDSRKFYAKHIQQPSLLKDIITLRDKKNLDHKLLFNTQSKKELLIPFPEFDTPTRIRMRSLVNFFFDLKSATDALSRIEKPVFIQFQTDQLQNLVDKSVEEIQDIPCLKLYDKNFVEIGSYTYKQIAEQYKIPGYLSYLDHDRSSFYTSFQKDSTVVFDANLNKILSYATKETRARAIPEHPNHFITQTEEGNFDLYHYDNAQLQKKLSFPFPNKGYIHWRTTNDKNYVYSNYEDSLLLWIDLRENKLTTINWDQLIQATYQKDITDPTFLDNGLCYFEPKNKHVFYYDQEDKQLKPKYKARNEEDCIIDLFKGEIVGRYKGYTYLSELSGHKDIIKQISPDAMLRLWTVDGEIILEEPYLTPQSRPEIFDPEISNSKELKTIVDSLGKITNIPKSKLLDKAALFKHLDISSYEVDEIFHFSSSLATVYNKYDHNEFSKAFDKNSIQLQAKDYLIVQKTSRDKYREKTTIVVYQIAS